MLGDVEVQDPSTVMTDDEETVRMLNVIVGDGEEVHRPNGYPVISQNASQRLLALESLGARFIQREMVRSENIERQHEKLPVNARVLPGRILRDHSEDQITNSLKFLFYR